MAKKKNVSLETFIPISGQWRFERGRAVYGGPDEKAMRPVGVCLSPVAFRAGVARAKVTIKDQKDAAARIIVGYNSATEGYFSIGIGGYDFAYVADVYTQTGGWRAIHGVGAKSHLVSGRPYEIKVEAVGQRASLSIDNVRVMEITLPAPLEGEQAGLFAWGTEEVRFEDISLSGTEPQVFVVMQFGKPYDSLYREVIQRVCQKLGFVAVRADDLFRPGVILEDIRQGIVESDVIVAEITPVNANVYYELGYAHALDKASILLANRTIDKLPFDISGYRVIFYDDSIGGKSEIEQTLEKHLVNIREGRRERG
jgi:hypothetical protein